MASTSAMDRRTSLLNHMFLLYLIVPAIYLFYYPITVAFIGLGLLSLFAISYVLTYSNRVNFNIGVVAQVVILIGLVGYLSPYFLWLTNFPSATLGIRTPTARQLMRRMCSLSAIYILECLVLWGTHRSDSISSIAMGTVAIIASFATSFGCFYNVKARQQRLALEEANREIERLTKIAERERIARDLHDVMGHELSMITLKAQLAERMVLKNTDRAKQEIRDIELAARNALGQVRAYVAGIGQSSMLNEWRDAKALLEAANIVCHSPDIQAVSKQLLKINAEEQHALSMCLREAVTNIVRHSQASQVWLDLYFIDGDIDGDVCLAVADNGCGISADKHPVGGTGLNNIGHRIEGVSGSFHMWSHGRHVLGSDPNLFWPSHVPTNDGIQLLLRIPNRTSNRNKEHSPQEKWV